MIKIINRNEIINPSVSIIIHERGFIVAKNKFTIGDELNEIVKIIETIAEDVINKDKKVQLSLYDDAPASGTKSIEFVCDNIEVLKLARTVQIEFNGIFGHENISISLI